MLIFKKNIKYYKIYNLGKKIFSPSGRLELGKSLIDIKNSIISSVLYSK